MIIRSMNNEKEFPEGTTVMDCLKALDAFPRGTLAAQSGGVVCELNDVPDSPDAGKRGRPPDL